MKSLEELEYKVNQLNTEHKIIDCSDWELNHKYYGGTGGRKLGLTSPVGGEYMLKFATPLKGMNSENMEVAYGNNPIVEYISSRVFRHLNVPVQDTMLAWYNGELVVLCEDFTSQYEDLVEFDKIKNVGACEYADRYNADSMNIWEIMYLIKNTESIKIIKDELLETFFNTFVIDYLNGNTDRSLDNFGILVHKYYAFPNAGVAPVYDNGNCLSFMLSKRQIKECLDNDQIFMSRVCNVPSRFTERGRNIVPLEFISAHFELFRKFVDRVLQCNILEELPRIFNCFREIDDYEMYVEFYTKTYEHRLSQLSKLHKFYLE